VLTDAFFREADHRWERVRDERIDLALRAAQAAADDADDQPAPAAGVHAGTDDSAQQQFSEAFAALGHDVFRVGDFICCQKCAGTCRVAAAHTARKLKEPCLGLSKVKATRENQLTAIKRVRRGLAPRPRGGDKLGEAPTASISASSSSIAASASI